MRYHFCCGPQDKAKAGQLYKKACDAGLEAGCLRLCGVAPPKQ